MARVVGVYVARVWCPSLRCRCVVVSRATGVRQASSSRDGQRVKNQNTEPFSSSFTFLSLPARDCESLPVDVVFACEELASRVCVKNRHVVCGKNC